jgi:NAD(P)-dependent dehydrogenase (short-subunit alcohol dehydrogenase family)
MAATLEGRIALVTGRPRGSDRRRRSVLAARGAQVVLVGRDRARAEAARKDVSERSGMRASTCCSRTSRRSTPCAGSRASSASDIPRCILLVNNAGIAMTERVLTSTATSPRSR